MKTINELEDLIIQWAQDKDLLKEDNAPKQYLKFLSEVGETADAILKNDIPEIKDGFGYIAVTIIILANQLKMSLNLDEDKFINFDSDCMETLFEFVNSSYTRAGSISLLWSVAQNYGYDLTECLNLAWNEIKDRKGKTVRGTFIKH